MNQTKRIYTLSILLALAGVCTAQPLIPEWEISLESNVQWMEINDWGILLAATNDGLYGIDPANGQSLWKIPELTSLKREGYRVIPGTPVSLLEDGPLLIAVNGLTGKVIVNSAQAGFEKISQAETTPEINGLLVEYKNGKEKGLALFDLATGEKKWVNEFADLKGGGGIQPGPRIDEQGNIIYSYGKNLFCLNGETGEVRWQKETPKDIKDLFFDPEKSLIVSVSGSVSNAFQNENTDGMITTTSGGGKGKFYIQAFDVTSGEELWDHEYQSKYSGIAVGTEDFALFHIFSINFIAFATGEKKWAKEPKYVGGGRNAGLIVDEEGIIYAMESEVTPAKTFIYYLDHEGNEKWKKAPYTSTPLNILEPVPDGLLYASHTGANIVDMGTGKVVWTEDKYLSSGGIPILISYDKDENPLLLVRGQIVRILPEAGDWEVLCEEVRLYGEIPATFEQVEEGYRVTSPQNALMFDQNGKERYHVYYPAPEQSFGKRMLLSIGSVAVASTTLATAGTSYATHYVVGELGDNDDHRAKAAGYFDLFSGGAAAAESLALSARRRFKEQIDAPDYKLILTKKEKNIGLVKVDLNTGKEAGFVVTEDRTPEFVLDRVDNKLFFKSGLKRIAAYGM